ncbi:hypothetical protein EAO28_00050 [Klebsiella pneumoniae]|uniref:Uncharacterized protein n=1 Tax=Klebsiella pneumoniae TaxID=573 RepID=A0A3P2EJ73_KLEPN|nr:hypothetical protein EAO28_00050 [Klebsiella pneumoniae]
MPYYIMRDKKFLQSLKKNKVSQGISVLKLFIVICLKSDIDEEGKIGANLTYDDFAAMCSLSRKLINSGLRVLEEAKIIRTKGERKKRYILINCKPREKVEIWLTLAQVMVLVQNALQGSGRRQESYPFF